MLLILAIVFYRDMFVVSSPRSFHPDCAGLSKIPEGFWSCPECTSRNLSAVDAATAAAAAASTSVGGIRNDSAPRVSLAPSLPSSSTGHTVGLQSGLDQFHQKLNACLDYTQSECYDIDGFTFQCFPQPNLALMDPVKAAAAQKERAEKVAAAVAAKSATTVTNQTNNTNTSTSPNPVDTTPA
jgi:hypothetical protein